MPDTLLTLAPAPDFMRTAWFAVTLVFLGAGLILLVAGAMALWRARPWRSLIRLLVGALMVSIGFSLGVLGFGIQGYRALSHEALAATLTVRPLSHQRFEARVRWPDGYEEAYVLTGDEIYIDARVLKWHPRANILGLHTLYELDRLAGRYRDVEQERAAERTVYELRRAKPVDVFDLRKRYDVLEPLVDASYGSASFVAVGQPMRLELRVSTTGLLLREAPIDGVTVPAR